VFMRRTVDSGYNAARKSSTLIATLQMGMFMSRSKWGKHKVNGVLGD